MPSTSGQQPVGMSTHVAIAILGFLFFTRKVVRARAIGAQSSSASSSRSRRDERTTPTAFAVGLLDIAIPRDDRPGGSFARAMINDACINRAVHEVSSKLLISIRDAESMPAGRVRAYVSGLYQEVYDAAYAAKRPHLDVRVLLPKEAASGAGTVTRTSRASATVIPTATTAPGRVDASIDNGGTWMTRHRAELEPDLEVLLSDAPPAEEQLSTLNALRIKAGCPGVRMVSLESVASKAYRSEYFYAEDVTAEIPVFANVACGGTFDRLHGGHKKLLTFAAR